jgi:hypothetical protein
MKSLNLKALIGLGLGLVVALAPAAQAAPSLYYVGNDTAAGSNEGHLTFLFNHGDHFHRLGPFGAAEGRIPEASVGGALKLFEGTGAFSNRYVSGGYHIDGDATSEYSDLEIRPISTLLGFPDGSPEATLINGGQRYLGSLAGTSIALELVSKSAGVHVADGQGNIILTNLGDRFLLGPGESFASFTPLFVTDPFSAAGATYGVSLRLVDLNGRVPESGTFRFELQSVPEPASVVLLGTGALGLFGYGRRRRRDAGR